jgi:hypothetical protein
VPSPETILAEWDDAESRYDEYRKTQPEATTKAWHEFEQRMFPWKVMDMDTDAD